MNNKPYSNIVIDRLEYYITKEIERALFNKKEKNFFSLHQRILECINARRELNYAPLYMDAKELLDDHGYDIEFINEFIILAQLNAKEMEIISSIDESIANLNNISIQKILCKIEDYIIILNKINDKSPLDNIEAMLTEYNYDSKIIKLIIEKLQHDKS